MRIKNLAKSQIKIVHCELFLLGIQVGFISCAYAGKYNVEYAREN